MKKLTPLVRRALTKAEVCARIRVSSPIFDRIVRERKLRVFYPTPHALRVLPEDLETFIAEHATISPKTSFATLTF
jgi:hypothetical protein